MIKTPPAIHYVVRINYRDRESPDSAKFSFKDFEFKDEEPIKARAEAFKWFDNHSNIDLIDKGLGDRYADRLTGHSLQEYFNSLEVSGTSIMTDFGEWILENPEAAVKLTSYGHPELILIVDEKSLLDEGRRSHKIVVASEELSIYKIVNMNDPLDVSEYILNLDQEYSIYQYFGYSTGGLEQEVLFFDPEAVEEETQLGNHRVLKTPFDWDGYEKPDWWMTEDDYL